MNIKTILWLIALIAAGVSHAATTYNLANGNVTVPANTTAIITQSNNKTSTTNSVTINAGATVTLQGINIQCDRKSPIACMGNATIIISDGSSNTVDQTVGNTTQYAAIFAGPPGSTLTIKGESAGTGKLIALSNYGAAIGAHATYQTQYPSAECGNIVIQGGIIYAKATGTGGSGSGIGASWQYKSGDITITGGNVYASSSMMCGIGGEGGNITITGGKVTAIGATYGTAGSAGIGSSYWHGSVGDISISGGIVRATAGGKAAAIGTGQTFSTDIYRPCGNINITGGDVVATAVSNGVAAIGAGYRGKVNGNITIGNGITKVVANVVGTSTSHITLGSGSSGTITLDSKLKQTKSNNNLTLTLTPTYKIVWKNENGTTLETDARVDRGVVPTYNGSTPTKASTAQYSYTFKGWSPTVAAATTDKTYTATFNANLRSYTVTWKNADGSTIKTDTFPYGTMPAYEGDTPTKTTTGEYTYIFEGWSPEFASVTSNVTYMAKFTEVGFKPIISPESGTTFDSSLTVSMSCPTEGATIYYTTNGVDPTVESAEYRRFRIYGKTTVKAIAEKDGILSDVVTAEYALGRCVDPVFSLADGAEFTHSNQVVSIRWNNDGILRYTLDGSEPTAESPVYDGPFTFNDSAVIKAKVFSDDFFDSAVVTASLTRVWENVATPVIDAVESFTGSKTKVVISCATDGAIVRYTLNGNEPNSHSTKYTGSFYVTDSCTVKAYAVKIDYLNSAVATHAIEKVWGIGDSLGKPDHGFATEGDGGAGWTRVEDTTAPNGEAMKSGAISDNQTSTLSTTVVGPGTLSFSWRTSCEEDALHEWDHAEFAVDGNVRLYRDGVNSWQQESVRIEGGGEHTVTWVYKKDDVESEGDDAAWVAGYGWVSDLTETQTTDVHVPYAWLLGHDPEIVDEYDAYEAAAKVTGANGHKAWESYVIGADPNDKDDSLKITAFPMKADGTPDFESITISPPQSRWNVEGAQAVFKGKSALDDAGEWQTLTDENKADMRFFKVEVVLP